MPTTNHELQSKVTNVSSERRANIKNFEEQEDGQGSVNV